MGTACLLGFCHVWLFMWTGSYSCLCVCMFVLSHDTLILRASFSLECDSHGFSCARECGALLHFSWVLPPTDFGSIAPAHLVPCCAQSADSARPSSKGQCVSSDLC